MKIEWAVPDIGETEKKAVAGLFDINWLSQGPKVKEFETKMSEFFQRKYALAVNNGTAALDIALKLLDIKQGDEVILPAMSYIATGSMVLNRGAKPVFADIDRERFTISVDSVINAITEKTKILLTMDYGGNPCDYDELEEICKKKNIFLLVDAAQSLGGIYKNKPLGSFGGMATMSFHSAKVMTTVEGGMIMTDNPDYAEKIRILRNQGEDTKVKYRHIMVGFNARMTDMQAAIGLEQYKKLKSYIEKRAKIADYFIKEFSKSEKIKTIKIHPGGKMAFFLFPILVENRDEINKKINSAGIDTRLCYHYPMYKHPAFEKYADNYCPNAEWVSDRVINLPIHNCLSDTEIEYICDKVVGIIENN